MKDIELIKWIRKLIKTNNTHAFYISSVWIKMSRRILKEQNYECQRCKAKGIYKKARMVHHKKYLRRHPELALTSSNLEALCDTCHYEEHHKNKGFVNIERW